MKEHKATTTSKITTNSQQTKLLPVLELLAERWGGDMADKWLVGGSTGLLLQGVELSASPRDLDVYADRRHITPLHQALAEYAQDQPEDSETGMYRSNLSHYEYDGITVELVGSLQVDRGSARYEVEIDACMSRYAAEVRLPSGGVRLMPLMHELLFNVLRERPDRFEPIAEAIRRNPEAHREALIELLQRSSIGEPFRSTLHDLLPDFV